MGIGCWAIVSLFISGCHPPPDSTSPTARLDPSLVSGNRAFEAVTQLVAITPRHAGSPGAAKAAEHLKAALTPYTSSCEINSFDDETPHGTVTFRNVIGVTPGTGNDLIIIASHYDTKSGISDTFQGANDSGSSSGLVIELARVLHAQQPLPFTVLYAFFDGEECMVKYDKHDGLHGSRQLVKTLRERGKLSQVKAMILLDMVGDSDLTITLPRNVDHKLLGFTFDAAHAAGVRKKFTLTRTTILDDHVPFLEAGVPTINLIDFQHGSQSGKNDYWHTEQDSIEHVSADSLQSIGEVVIHMLNAIAAD